MKLTDERMDEIISALLVEPTIAAAAARLGVSERTLYRMQNLPKFARRYRRVRQHAVSLATGHVQRMSILAVHTLAHAVSDMNSPASTRIAAARVLLQMAVDAVHTDDILVRLRTLERTVRKMRVKTTPPPTPIAAPEAKPTGDSPTLPLIPR